MANELNTAQPTSGLSITAQLFQTGITVGAAVTCAEVGTTRFYSGNMPAITAGTYQVVFYSSAITPVSSGVIAWNGSAEILVNDLSTATTAGTAQAVWDRATTAITTSDTIGTLLKTNIDATISSRSTATTAGIADAVWDEAMSGHTESGSYGARIVRSFNSNNELQLTGSHHAAADVHEFQNEVIADYAFAPSAITLLAIPETQEIHAIHGLKVGDMLTVTPTSRTAGAIAQTIGGDGTTTTTVSRD